MKSFIYLLTILFILTSSHGFSQAYIPMNKASKKETKTWKKAYKQIQQGKITTGLAKYAELVESNPKLVEVWEQMAYTYADLGDYNEARKSIEKAISFAPEFKDSWYLVLANYCNLLSDSSCEKENLATFLSKAKTDKRIDVIQGRLTRLIAKEALGNDFEDIEIERLPSVINAEGLAQYKALLTVDGKSMVFTRRLEGQEDFYISYLKDGQWTEATPIYELNTDFNEGAHTITADGKYMLFTRCNVPGKYPGCDIYFTYKKNGKYVDPIFFELLNTNSWESQPAYSADGNTIVFTSNRSGGYGEKDLWITQRINGEWTEVKNMGKVLNTAGNEASPFLHPDGQTLYFMSDGHIGYGGMDLFVSKKNADGTWSDPLNMGSKINSREDEGALSLDVFGEYAYFSKSDMSDNVFKSDIYRFLLPKAFKPEPVTYISFKVTDAETGESLLAKAELISKDNIRKLINIEKNESLTVIPANTSYELHVEKEGYIFYADFIEFDQTDKLNPVLYNIELFPIKEVKVESAPPVILKNVLFETGNAELKTSSYYELDKLVNILKENMSLRVQINGHTDNVGSPETNLQLSIDRAESVKSYLTMQGIEDKRISIKGYGETKPISDNETKKGRSLNRRTEFELRK